MSANLVSAELLPPVAPLLVECKNGWWQFHGQTVEEHLACWNEIKSEVERDYWMLASIAASLTTRYNEKTVASFAHEVRLSARRIWEMAATYRAFEKCERSQILSFHHHTIASRAPEPEKVIQKAEDEEWSTRELDNYVQTKRPTVSQGIRRSPKTVKANADLQAHIERTISKIENEIKPDCPDSDFIRRHYDSWLDDLKFELQERAIVEAQDKILEAWEYGNRTDIELQKATGFTKGVIGQVLGRLGWEKIRQGGKTDTARGDRPWIWHKPGEAMGSDAQIPRSVYQNGEQNED